MSVAAVAVVRLPHAAGLALPSYARAGAALVDWDQHRRAALESDQRERLDQLLGKRN